MEKSKIEITPEMIEEGVKILEFETNEFNLPCKDEIVISIFSAMDGLRPKKKRR